jgi:WD40 repeat protein
MNNGSKTLVMQSHSDGEVWGLDLAGDKVLTTGDDNQVKVWDTNTRKCIATAQVSATAKSLKRRGASSLTSFPDS